MLRSISRVLSTSPRQSFVRPFATTRHLRSPANMETVNTTDRLTGLRELMGHHKIDIYIVPSADAHYSEYVAASDERRPWICGFSGSAGTAVVTGDKAALATDGRYFNQAEKQLDGNWTLLKQGMQDVPTWQEWTIEQAEQGKIVGVDPTTITAPDARKLDEKIIKKGGKGLVPVHQNLIDELWGKERPAAPAEPVRALKQEYTGKSLKEKIEELRKEITTKKAEGFVVNMLDEVAWLFNLRGSDIPYNPVFFSYAVVTATAITLYVDESKFEDGVKSELDGVTVRPYEAIFDDLKTLIADEPTANGTTNGSAAPSKRKYLISNNASWAISEALGGEANTEEIRSPIGDAKAIKNETELKGVADCHIRDGAALTAYFAWLENELVNKKTKLDEVQAADKLESLRSQKDKFVGLSFPTISSTGANAAVIHYQPERDNCATIDPEKIYLCDSGAQYLDGTTDTTRTLHFGNPTEKEIETYTLVLKGNIALDKCVFPKGTTGFAIDMLARQYLWANGLEYRHGTGHGIGSYLNVHEGPIGIGTRVSCAEVPLSVGNVLSNEPGYYEDGNFGIRIENVMYVKEVPVKHKFGDKPFFGFQNVTMTPLCRKLVDVSLLTDAEKQWINAFHRDVYEKTSDYFKDDQLTSAWLERECAAY